MVQTTKARTHYTKYEPALSYNDFVICGSSSSFKNGNPFDSLLSFINKTTNQYPDTNRPPSLLSNKDEVSIYPNPTSDLVTIRYHFVDGKPRTLVLFDMLGRELNKIELKKGMAKVQLDLSNHVPGLYTYSIYENKKAEFTGKITITR